MEASSLRGKHAALTCDHCGYALRGLPASANCPECGHAPHRPAMLERGVPALTRRHQSQLRLITLGLIVLMLGSISAIRVAIIMNSEQLSLNAINVPSPKISSVALVQREVGGQPGYWGTLGWTAVLTQLIGVWLITSGRLHPSAERLFSLRRICRWTALLTTSALMGFFLSHGTSYVPLQSWLTNDLLFYALAFGELPVNTLVYLHLARLSAENRQPRLKRTFVFIAWYGAIVRSICAVVLVVAMPVDVRDKYVSFTLACTACVAIPAGIVAWAAVGTLTGRLALLSYRTPGRRVIRLIRDHAPILQQIIRIVDHHGTRIAFVIGILLWLYATTGQFATAVAGYPTRKGLGGDVPLMNYVGPKMAFQWHGSDLYDRWRRVYVPATDLWLLLAIVMLLTTSRAGEPPAATRWRQVTRWSIILLLGVHAALLIWRMDEPVRPSYVSAARIVFCEAPATLLMMMYLARLARSASNLRVQRSLHRVGVVATLLIVSPVVFYVLSKSLRPWHNSIVVGSICAVYGMLSFTAGVCATRTLLMLAWDVARPLWASEIVTTVERAPVVAKNDASDELDLEDSVLA